MSIGDSIRPRTESQFCDECPTLLAHHFDQLHTGSGISIDVIKEQGYKSILSKKELAQLGFSPSQQRVPGLLMPMGSPSGQNSNHQYRSDSPRLNRDGKSIKCETPKGARIYRLSRHLAYGNSPASRQYTCRPGETCIDLEKLLSHPNIRESDLEAVKLWLQKHTVDENLSWLEQG